MDEQQDRSYWGTWTGADPHRVPKEIDTSVAHPARRYDYWLGGKDHFPADRASGDAVAAVFPGIRAAVRENRRFLGRAVRFLSSTAGIDQFLDIGTGIPAADSTHEVAQRVNPAARVVYVDNDPVVLAHARALLVTGEAGATAYMDADLRDPRRILTDPALMATLDLTRPVALMIVAVMHFIQDEHRPYDLVRTLLDALPGGSYLVMSHATNDYFLRETADEVDHMSGPVHGDFRPRSHAEFTGFFDGLELVPPGVVSIADWRADGEPLPRPSAEEVATYAGVARLPEGR